MFFLCFSTILSAVLVPCVYGIIWFEHDNHNRTIINQLVSSKMWWLLIWILLIQPPTYFVFAFGPIEISEFCTFHTFARNVVILQVLLLQNVIIAVRYIFIFHIKNPTAMQDDYWRIFLNIWTIGFSVISQFVFAWLPGKSPLHYFVCMGENLENVNNQLAKQNIPLSVLAVTSFGLFSILRFRTSLSKEKETIVMSSFSTKPLFSFTALGFGILMITFFYVIIRIVNKMNVNVNHQHWQYMLFIFMPQLVISSIIATYYVQYSKLRNKIWVELKAYLQQFYQF
jgi:hypothetical protein